MSKILYQIAQWVVRRRGTVVLAWVIALFAVAGSAAAFSGPTSDAFRIPGTESQQALDLLAKKFPGTGGASARIVVEAPEGRTFDDPVFKKAATQALAALATAPQVIGVSGFDEATLSKDKRIAFADVQYAVPVDQVTQSSRDALEKIAQPARAAGLTVEFSGGVVSTAKKSSNSEAFGILIAFLVLSITFGGLVAAGMPLITALIGVVIGLLGVQALSGVVSMSSTAPTLALMLGLAVGIDYSLFIISRHRAQVRAGMAIPDSIAMAVATAGGAVVFAGLTVVIALVGLSVVGIPFLTVMGLAAAGTIAVAVLISITLVPAMLALLGSRLDRGRIGFLARRQEAAAGRPNGGQRWAHVVTAKPVVTLLVGIAALGVFAVPMLHMNLGLPDDSSKSTSTTERRAYDLLTKGFGPGFNGPLTLVIDAPGVPDLEKKVADNLDGFDAFSDVATVGQPIVNQAGDVVILSVTPKSSPSSAATQRLVREMRASAENLKSERGVSAYVTGPTAVNIDVSDTLANALPKFLLLIVGLALVLLILVFRSILVPIKAVAGFLLTIGASLGLVVFVFQQGHLGGLFGIDTPGPVVSFIPILLVGILFGLAMDYEVFLVSRIREEYVRSGQPRAAIAAGMTHSARVITAAAMIMIAVFSGFIFADNVVVKSLGLALSFGVLVDAFVVRMTLVPAVLALLGNRAWALPKRLDKMLPDLDIEGTKLAETRHAAELIGV